MGGRVLGVLGHIDGRFLLRFQLVSITRYDTDALASVNFEEDRLGSRSPGP